jgi:hypothetical protein
MLGPTRFVIRMIQHYCAINGRRAIVGITAQCLADFAPPLADGIATLFHRYGSRHGPHPSAPPHHRQPELPLVASGWDTGDNARVGRLRRREDDLHSGLQGHYSLLDTAAIERKASAMEAGRCKHICWPRALDGRPSQQPAILGMDISMILH